MLNAVDKIISKEGRIQPVVIQNINTLYHNGMKSTKIFTGCQPRIINKYKILKHKILKCNANIYFSILIR